MCPILLLYRIPALMVVSRMAALAPAIKSLPQPVEGEEGEETGTSSLIKDTSCKLSSIGQNLATWPTWLKGRWKGHSHSGWQKIQDSFIEEGEVTNISVSVSLLFPSSRVLYPPPLLWQSYPAYNIHISKETMTRQGVQASAHVSSLRRGLLLHLCHRDIK